MINEGVTVGVTEGGNQGKSRIRTEAGGGEAYTAVIQLVSDLALITHQTTRLSTGMHTGAPDISTWRP